MEEKVVCVTGAGGYLASWVVKLLLTNGYIVHATARDPCDEKTGHLKKLENASKNMKMYKTDLLDYEGLFAAISGCNGVFHLASPVPELGHSGNKEELIEAAVSGTQNVLKACLKANVKKVVVVSSVAAIVYNPNWPKGQVMDEECWSDLQFCNQLEKWYALAKTSGEREAWEYARKNELNMVTFCPSIIIGPMLQLKLNASSIFLLNFLKDKCETMDSGHRALVDVRDAAEALLLIYQTPEVQGRYVCSAYQITPHNLVQKLKTMYPNYNYPKGFLKGDMGVMLSSEKLLNLGWNYRPLEDTLVDAIDNFQERGAFL